MMLTRHIHKVRLVVLFLKISWSELSFTHAGSSLFIHEAIVIVWIHYAFAYRLVQIATSMAIVFVAFYEVRAMIRLLCAKGSAKTHQD